MGFRGRLCRSAGRVLACWIENQGIPPSGQTVSIGASLSPRADDEGERLRRRSGPLQRTVNTVNPEARVRWTDDAEADEQSTRQAWTSAGDRSTSTRPRAGETSGRHHARSSMRCDEIAAEDRNQPRGPEQREIGVGEVVERGSQARAGEEGGHGGATSTKKAAVVQSPPDHDGDGRHHDPAGAACSGKRLRARRLQPAQSRSRASGAAGRAAAVRSTIAGPGGGAGVRVKEPRVSARAGQRQLLAA